MRQLRADTHHRRVACKQHAQVNITARADLAADLRSEEVYQPHLSLRVDDSFDASLETLDVDPRHQPTSRIKNRNVDRIVPHTPLTRVTPIAGSPVKSSTYSILLGRYWIASAKCAGWMRSDPARSAIVRASLSTR